MLNKEKAIYARVPGKIIITGEHAVVYGYPAIAMAINVFSTCKISVDEEIQGLQIRFLTYENSQFILTSINEWENPLPDKFNQFFKGFQLIATEYSKLHKKEIPIQNISIEVSSHLWQSAGLGSSASTSIAFITALSEFFNLSLSHNKISELGYEMEKFVHGTPSGIDNMVCSHGGILYYQNSQDNQFILSKERISRKLTFLLIHTGKKHDTKQAVENVYNLKDQNPDLVAEIFKQIGEISINTKDAIINGDLKRIGNLMSQNHKLLKELNISSPEIEQILSIAENIEESLKKYIFGAKLTGAGQGGAVILLMDPKIGNNIKQLESIFQEKKFQTKQINTYWGDLNGK